MDESVKLCTKCGHNPAPRSSPWCRGCLAQNEKNSRRRIKEAGLCVECRAIPAKTGRSLCEKCAKKRALVQFKRKAVQYLGGACLDCGLRIEHIEVYDFHHLDPSTKEFPLGLLVNYTWERVLAELDKCALLCANCHRIREWGQETI